MTSWLSNNLIKWNYINLESENRRVIDSNHSKKHPFPELTAMERPVPKRRRSPAGADGFQEGVDAIDYDHILEEERKKIQAEKEFVLEDARRQADELVTQARTAAESIKNDAYESGFQSGLAAGQTEAARILEGEQHKLQAFQEGLEQDYQERLRATEPVIADFMVKLVEKLTGVVVEDKEEVILHLVRCGLEQTGKSKQFTIRVSSEDYQMVEAQKDHLLLLMDGQGELLIQEDKGFARNQCIIETDTAIIESSLDVQLKNLTEDIRLMALRMDG